jgi:hypothetical protein
MNAADLAQLASLTARTRALLEQLRALASLPLPMTEDPRQILKEITQLDQDLADVIWGIQHRAALCWGRRPPRHQAPPRLSADGPPLSTEIPHGLQVRRFGPTGLPATEAHTEAPAPSGIWQQGRLGVPRPNATRAVRTGARPRRGQS